MTTAETLAKEQARAKREALELEMLWQLKADGLTLGMVRQWRPFATPPRYVFDFAWPRAWPSTSRMLCAVVLEIEGGIWTGGAHARGAGITRDIEKGNRAALAGFLCLRATAAHIKSGQALEWVQQSLRHP